MDDQFWQQQLMLERMRSVEEALLRAEKHEATQDDWFLIYAECGIRRNDGTYRKSER